MRYLLPALWLLCAFPAHVQAKPRHWYRNPETWARVGVMAGALAADAYTTCQGEAHGLVDPSTRTCKSTAIKLSFAFGFYNVLNYASTKVDGDGPQRGWRIAARWSVPIIVGAIHGAAAAHNEAVLHGR